MDNIDLDLDFYKSNNVQTIETIVRSVNDCKTIESTTNNLVSTINEIKSSLSSINNSELKIASAGKLNNINNYNIKIYTNEIYDKLNKKVNLLKDYFLFSAKKLSAFNSTGDMSILNKMTTSIKNSLEFKNFAVNYNTMSNKEDNEESTAEKLNDSNLLWLVQSTLDLVTTFAEDAGANSASTVLNYLANGTGGVAKLLDGAYSGGAFLASDILSESLDKIITNKGINNENLITHFISNPKLKMLSSESIGFVGALASANLIGNLAGVTEKDQELIRNETIKGYMNWKAIEIPITRLATYLGAGSYAGPIGGIAAAGTFIFKTEYSKVPLLIDGEKKIVPKSGVEKSDTWPYLSERYDEMYGYKQYTYKGVSYSEPNYKYLIYSNPSVSSDLINEKLPASFNSFNKSYIDQKVANIYKEIERANNEEEVTQIVYNLSHEGKGSEPIYSTLTDIGFNPYEYYNQYISLKID